MGQPAGLILSESIGQRFSTDMKPEGLIAQQEIWSFREAQRGALTYLRHADFGAYDVPECDSIRGRVNATVSASTCRQSQ